jgi:uncharacterized protein YcfJ
MRTAAPYSFSCTNDIPRKTMEASAVKSGLHPLMAGAAVSVMLVSLLGAAAITGIIPTSHSSAAPVAAAAPVPAVPAAALAAPVVAQAQPALAATPAPAPASVKHQTVVHHRYVNHPAPVARQQPQHNTQVARASQNSPVGIATGAVVGGIIGSQVGGGNGKTLATIAGAVGGGYVGNEIARRY